MLILGCDVGSEIHYVRAIDTRGRELSKYAFAILSPDIDLIPDFSRRGIKYFGSSENGKEKYKHKILAVFMKKILII